MAASPRRMEGRAGNEAGRSATHHGDGQKERDGRDVHTWRCVRRAVFHTQLTKRAETGGYVFGSPASQRQLSVPIALHTDSRVFSLDYRLAPESTFPGPLHDAVSGYLRLVEDLHIPPENIIVSGDSAGGGLSLALMLYLRDNEYPMPAGAILMSPWVGKYPSRLFEC